MYDRFLITNSHFKTFFHFNAQIRYRKSFKNFATLHLGRTPTQRVFINQNSSKSFNIDCGVPQGSYSGLGPILFIMYLGDSTSLRTTYLVSICTQIIFSCICPSCHSRHLLKHVALLRAIQASVLDKNSWEPSTQHCFYFWPVSSSFQCCLSQLIHQILHTNIGRARRRQQSAPTIFTETVVSQKF